MFFINSCVAVVAVVAAAASASRVVVVVAAAAVVDRCLSSGSDCFAQPGAVAVGAEPAAESVGATDGRIGSVVAAAIAMHWNPGCSGCYRPAAAAAAAEVAVEAAGVGWH